jgi:hypothetical protein
LIDLSGGIQKCAKVFISRGKTRQRIKKNQKQSKAMLCFFAFFAFDQGGAGVSFGSGAV